CPAALDVKLLDARVEIDQADSHASQAHNRQAGPVALAFDQPPLLDIDFQGIGENVDGIETDLLGHVNAVGRVLSGLRPRRVDKAEFHELIVSDGSAHVHEKNRNPN